MYATKRRFAKVDRRRNEGNFELTHDLNFQRSSSAVALSVARHAGVRSLVAHPLDVLDDKRAVGEDFLFPVDRQNSGVAFPHDALDRISGNRAGHAKSLAGDDGLFVHVANEGQTVNVEARRVLRGSNLQSTQLPYTCSFLSFQAEKKETALLAFDAAMHL